MSASSRVAPGPAVNRLPWVAEPVAPDASAKYDHMRFPPFASLLAGVKEPAESAGCRPELRDVPLTGAAVATPWNSEMVYWKTVLSMGALNEMVMVVMPGRAFGRTKIAEAMSLPAFVPESRGGRPAVALVVPHRGGLAGRSPVGRSPRTRTLPIRPDSEG